MPMPQAAAEPTAESTTSTDVPIAVAEPVMPEPVAIVAPVAQPSPVAEIQAIVPEPTPAIDISSDLAQAGLVMIETAASKAHADVAIELPRPQLGRKPKAPVLVADEPLQMVETRRE
jgi:hypothetical protein